MTVRDVEVRHQKALDLLEELDDGEADLVLTDPPYNVGMEYEEDLRPGRYWSWMYEFVREAERVAGEDGAIAMVTPKNQRRNWTGLLDQLSHKEIPGSPVPWCRPNILGKVPFGNGFHLASYFVYVVAGRQWEIVKDPPEDSDVTTHDYVVESSPQSNWEDGRHHPSQQPVGMYEKFVLKCCRRGDLVVDPFIGSGSVAVAAKKWGRRFVGCDISEEYVATARERERRRQVSNHSSVNRVLWRR